MEQNNRGVQVHTCVTGGRLMKKAFGGMVFISQCIVYRSWNLMLVVQDVDKAAFGPLCSLLVTLL